MAEKEKPKKVEAEPSLEAPLEEAVATVDDKEPPKDVAEKESIIPLQPPPPPLPPPHHKQSDKEEEEPIPLQKAAPEPAEEKLEGSVNRDAVLARVHTEKRTSFIRVWEETEKSKAANKADKQLCAIGSWENVKKASMEAEMKKIEKKLEKKKAEYVEKMRNKMALIHKAAEEKRAMVEAKRGEELLKAEETAAKYRATGTGPKKLLGIF